MLSIGWSQHQLIICWQRCLFCSINVFLKKQYQTNGAVKDFILKSSNEFNMLIHYKNYYC